MGRVVVQLPVGPSSGIGRSAQGVSNSAQADAIRKMAADFSKQAGNAWRFIYLRESVLVSRYPDVERNGGAQTEIQGHPVRPLGVHFTGRGARRSCGSRSLRRHAVMSGLLERVGEADQLRLAECWPGEGRTKGRR